MKHGIPEKVFEAMQRAGAWLACILTLLILVGLALYVNLLIWDAIL